MSTLTFNGKSYGPFLDDRDVSSDGHMTLYFEDPKAVRGLEKELYSIIPKKWVYKESVGYALLDSLSRDKLVLKIKDKQESSAIKVNYDNGKFNIYVKGMTLELNEKEAHNLGMEILSAFTIMSKVNYPTSFAT